MTGSGVSPAREELCKNRHNVCADTQECGAPAIGTAKKCMRNGGFSKP